MTTKCFMVDVDTEKIGDYWETPGAIFPVRSDNADDSSTHYTVDHAGKRPMLAVVLPDGNIWSMDAKAPNGSGWTVSGEPPNLTARPSVDSGTYHGWLTDGVFSDDLEGRTYEHATEGQP